MRDRNLKSFALLITEGWEHISNMSSYDEAMALKKQLELRADAYSYCLGWPKGGAKYSSQVLTDMGMIGIYRRGGKTVTHDTLQTPSLPIFSDEPPTVVTPKQSSGRAYDKPPAGIFAGSAA